MNELMPCPFCGDTYIGVHRIKYGNFTIGCNTLGCICLHTEGKLYSTENDAIEAWNRRTSNEG